MSKMTIVEAVAALRDKKTISSANYGATCKPVESDDGIMVEISPPNGAKMKMSLERFQANAAKHTFALGPFKAPDESSSSTTTAADTAPAA